MSADRTRPANKSDSRLYLAKAQEFLAQASGQDHRSAVDLVLSIMGSQADEPAKHLKRLIAKKNAVEYEQRRLTRAEAVELEAHASRFLAWAMRQLP